MSAHWSEDFALATLQEQQLQLLAQNFRTRQGEIDLILTDKIFLVFVEVRYRSSHFFGRPEETVNLKKQTRIRRTAEYFLSHYPNPNEQPCRFDVFSVSGQRENPKWKWIRSAF
ncbi:MAG: YraN family protein [Proteobacteria bacterium]|jgi:putative endonuclease|nr:YraN family protein [Pseudomonadota bacterium]MDB4827397.1 YraN family protein [Gammaproteobacteria bacterium]MBT4106213.1 YraN family protein [Pseudomonadota bacterium]MBT4357448.1 YraN family protein [Pseudomonadota bacterium]MBT4988744.1 YraN family protein [Pseudomonadota bacterium]